MLVSVHQGSRSGVAPPPPRTAARGEPGLQLQGIEDFSIFMAQWVPRVGDQPVPQTGAMGKKEQRDAGSLQLCPAQTAPEQVTASDPSLLLAQHSLR